MLKAVVGTENTANEYQTKKMWADEFSVRTSENYPNKLMSNPTPNQIFSMVYEL